MRASRTDVQGVLKEGGRGTGGAATKDRLRTAVIVGELALALVLLIGAGLLIRSGMALERVSPGFDPSHVLAARLSLPATDYKEPEHAAQAFEQVAAAAVPGVRSASLTSQVPMGRAAMAMACFLRAWRLISGTPSRAGSESSHRGISTPWTSRSSAAVR